jgi:hypothetical protein
MALPHARIVIADTQIKRLLALTWWAICPLCALLVARLSYERGCLDPYELLRPIMQRQIGALVVASVYIAAHVWLVAAVIAMVRGQDAWNTWKDERWKVIAMAAVIAVEQVPRAVWAKIYGGFCT